jgi:transglutaminase-like putative cysteine protease
MIGFLFDLISLIPISMIPALWIITYNFPEAPVLPAFLLSLFSALIMTAFLHLKAGGKLIMGGVLLSMALVSFIVIPEQIRNTFFENCPWVIPCLAISLIAIPVGKFLYSFEASRILLAVVLTAGLTVSLFLEAPPVRQVVALCFFFILCACSDETQLHWKKTGDTEHKAHLVFISPFLILFLAILMLFPAPDKPYDWSLARQIIDTASDRLDRMIEYFNSLGESDSADAFMGFSEDAVFHGSERSNERKVLEITFRTSYTSVIYLAGRSFDSFDGNTWTKTYDSDFNDVSLDSAETLCSIMQYTDNESDLVRHASADIRFINTHSSHLFAPSKTTDITNGPETVDHIEAGGDLLFTERKEYDDQYTIEYLTLNLGSPEFAEYLESPHIFDVNTWDESLTRLGVQSKPGMTAHDLFSYRERIRDTYLTDPVISDRLKNFLDEYLSDCENDIQKLRKIEALLSSMSYSNTPGPIPADVDTPAEFLDVMIFEKQEGYCVHYATAFVLLSRSIGIPSRFVQGYFSKASAGKVLELTENNSHAWPECYIEGVGWIIFEPTPGYRISQRWKTAAETEAEREVSASGLQPEIPEEPEVILPEKIVTEHGEESFNFSYILIILLAALAASVLLITINIFITSLRYKKTDSEKRFIICFGRNMKLLKILGFEKQGGETLSEFRCRATEEISDISFSFMEIYENYLYGSGKLEKEEVQIIENANSDLVKMIKRSGIHNIIPLIRYYLFRG